ncbi:hypothetical protein E2320_001033 [Naja naja]|nr:hypothetical protein E2320_001033 [Naja naja]
MDGSITAAIIVPPSEHRDSCSSHPARFYIAEINQMVEVAADIPFGFEVELMKERVEKLKTLFV